MSNATTIGIYKSSVFYRQCGGRAFHGSASCSECGSWVPTSGVCVRMVRVVEAGSDER